MSRNKKITDNSVLKIKLWGEQLGYLYWDNKQNAAVFEYDPEFIKNGIDPAPLTMSVKSERSVKGIPWVGNKEKPYQGLPPMIADSLPDKWGDAVFAKWMKDNKVKSGNITPVDRLAYIGSRGMGALEFEPAHLEKEKSENIDIQELYILAKKILTQREEVILNEQESQLSRNFVKLGTSAGGRRPKAIIAINRNTGEVRSGQVDAPEGFEHYIIKFDEANGFPSAKIEYSYYQMAKEAGIQMTDCLIKETLNESHFLTKRFDRNGNEKIHIQTLAAINPFCDSYEDIFTTMRKLKLPYTDMEQMFRRMVFNVFSRNIDDHTKNFSFMMDKTGRWKLAPAYDLTFTIDLSGPSYQNKQTLFINGKNDDISEKDLLIVGKENEINNPGKIIPEVKNAVKKFSSISKQNNVPDEWRNKIWKEISKQLNKTEKTE